MQLRDYQQRAHDRVLAAWGYRPWWDGAADTFRSTLLSLATSAGKTIIAAKLIETLVGMKEGHRVMFMADTDELCQQPLTKIKAATGIRATLEKASERADTASPVVVASLQTLARPARLEEFRAQHQITHVITDEAHRNSHRAKQVSDAFPRAKVLGMTGTAFRSNMKDLSAFFDHVADEVSALNLMDLGYVTPLKILSLPIEVDLTQVRQSQTTDGKDFNAEDVDTTIRPYYERVVAAIKEHAADRTIVAFLPLISSSQAFVEICKENGLSAKHCDGKSPDRSEILQQFEHGQFQILSNSQLFSTGVDFIKADCLLNLAPTRSVGQFRQRCGRILRIPPGVIDGLPTPEARHAAIAAGPKPDSLLLDLLWQVEGFGLAGPANLVADTEEEAALLATKARDARSPQELAEMRRVVQAEREAMVLEAQAKANALRAKSGMPFLSAVALGALLHDSKLMDYEPMMAWERQPMSPGQRKVLENLNVDVESVTGKGHACKVIEAIKGRQAQGLAPIEAFEALKKAGVAEPDTVTLDQAIRVLGDSFPNTFGNKYRGVPLKLVPKSFWSWVVNIADPSPLPVMKEMHPASYRYLTRVVYPQRFGGRGKK